MDYTASVDMSRIATVTFFFFIFRISRDRVRTWENANDRSVSAIPLVSSRYTETCLLDVLQLFPLQRR